MKTDKPRLVYEFRPTTIVKIFMFIDSAKFMVDMKRTCHGNELEYINECYNELKNVIQMSSLNLYVLSDRTLWGAIRSGSLLLWLFCREVASRRTFSFCKHKLERSIRFILQEEVLFPISDNKKICLLL